MTALRELLSELMSACEMIGYATSGNERANHRATRDKVKAELLSILDAEGDAAMDAARYRYARDHTKAFENWFGVEYSEIDSTIDAAKSQGESNV